MIETNRLILRPWNDDDLSIAIEMGAEPEIMHFFPSLQTEEMVREMIKRFQKSYQEFGYCFFAAIDKDSSEVVGMIGMQYIPFETHYTPAVEIGWRLRKKFWRKGLATEGAKAILDFAWSKTDLKEIYAMAVLENRPSIKVMENIGMTYLEGEDFNHPNCPEGSRYRKHVLYKIVRP